MKILLIALLLAVCLMLVSCGKEEKSAVSSDIEEYTGLPEFKEAYTKVKASIQSNNGYDIEQTVKVMNALDAALESNSNLDDYLQAFARTDLSRVAPDILKNKTELLDILQEMRSLDREEADINATNAFIGLIHTTKTSAATTVDSLPQIISGGIVGAVVIIGKETVSSACNEWENYTNAKHDLSAHFRVKMTEIKNHLLKYISSSIPIYEKYCREWDALCLKKDKAYIDIYNGRFDQSLKTTNEILEKYPENRETLLLNALSMVMLGMKSLEGEAASKAPLSCLYASADATTSMEGNSSAYFEKSTAVLDKYISLYPSYSAPALVLQGIIAICRGEETQGLTLLDQASIEFPRQASHLKEMFQLYKARTYLNKSVEGKYLLRLYLSTMEGYGMFSPNLIKSGYYAQRNEAELSKKEMFNHFFRRGNQESYDCLLSDMQFCEMFLDSSFRKMFVEHSFLDVVISKSIMDNNKLNVSIDNRSNVTLQNVRIFLCLHLTDMYTDEYAIVKVPSKNLVPAFQKTDFEPISFNYENKTNDDISHIRAIVMTDDAICWLDDVKYKLDKSVDISKKLHALKQAAGHLDQRVRLSGLTISELQEKLLPNINSMLVLKKKEGFVKGLADKFSTALSKSLDDKFEKADAKLKFELPRKLLQLDPVFSLKLENGRQVQPILCYVNNSNIRLMFDVPPEGKCTLYIYNRYVPCRIIYNRYYDAFEFLTIKLN